MILQQVDLLLLTIAMDAGDLGVFPFIERRAAGRYCGRWVTPRRPSFSSTVVVVVVVAVAAE